VQVISREGQTRRPAAVGRCQAQDHRGRCPRQSGTLRDCTPDPHHRWGEDTVRAPRRL